MQLAPDRDSAERELADLGPDAAAVSRQDLAELIAGRRGAVKSVLVDQGTIASLGNLLADEILWRAGIHPRRPARELTDAERRGLYDQLRKVLRAAVKAARVPPRPSWLTGPLRASAAGLWPLPAIDF